MDTDDFDIALVASALTLAEERGWARVSVVDAARHAGLSLSLARQRFPLQLSILLRLGRMADDVALSDDMAGGSVRERLFDLLMRRLDVFQQYRNGLRAVLRALPFNPAQAVLLGGATLESMRWMADAAGVEATGPAGVVRVSALVGVWTHALRAWEKDENPDMGSTMAALDQALDQAGRFGLFPASTEAAEDGTTGLPDLVQTECVQADTSFDDTTSTTGEWS